MNIYNNIDREKVQFDFIVTPEERKDLYDQVEQMGGRIFCCPKYTGKNHFAYCKWWNDFFEEHPEYHIIHGHVRSTAVIYLRIAKEHGLVTIAHSHSTSNGKGVSAVVKDVMQLPIRHTADYLFACSDKAGEWLYGKKATRMPNYQMIPNGVELDKFAFDEEKRCKMRRGLGITENTFVLGHVGRITAPKNHAFLVELFAEYHTSNPNSKLLLVGDGELLENVKQQVERLGIREAVIATGNRANTQDYYQAMDVFVFPSLWEGLPVSVVEAQASGLKCLLSDVITRDVSLTDQVIYLRLKDRDQWLENIKKAQAEGRAGLTKENREKLIKFDSKAVAEILQKFYLEHGTKK